VNLLLTTIFNGLAIGSIYALITLGFVVIYNASSAVNFAQGSLLVLGAYVIARLHASIGFWPAVLAGAAVTALAAGAEALIVRLPRSPDVATVAIITIGVNLVLGTELLRRIGVNVLTLGDPWQSRTARILGITVPQTRIASLIVAVVLIGALFAAFRWTRWGLALRASTQNREATALMGVRLGRLQLSAWCVAGALCAVAAVFLVAFPSAGLDATTGDIALGAFPAAIMGGLDSAAGALAGSLVVGLTMSATASYLQDLSFLGSGLPGVAPYLVMVLVLIARPFGLLGSKELARV
jgi:branched-chain amino acid transport system permease protein